MSVITCEERDRLVAAIGVGQDELDEFARTLNPTPNTLPVPELAIQAGANRLYNPDRHPPSQLARHTAACLAIAESVLYGVSQAGYHIVRPTSLCPDHGLPRCLRCRHDGTAHQGGAT